METGILTQKTAYEHKIPRTLHKRIPKKHLSENEDEKNASSTSNSPFASSSKQQISTTQYDFSSFHSMDKPPTYSLFDPRPDKFNKNTLSGDADSLVAQLVSKPQSFNNAFTKDRKIISNPNDQSHTSGLDLPWSKNTPISGEKVVSNSNINTNHRDTKMEFSVLVYGFSNSNFNVIMNHFAKFGRILEDFSISTKFKSLNNGPKKSYPIFMGPSWVKITYDNAQSSIRALAEDGNEEESTGSIIGVIPYRSDLVRYLLTAQPSEVIDILMGKSPKQHEFKSPLEEDVTFIEGLEIGESLRGIDNPVDNVNDVEISKRLRDGSSLLVKKESTGILANGIQLNRWLFGTGEI